MRRYFLRRLDFLAFFLAAFLNLETCFFSRAISRACLRDLALALFKVRFAAARTFFRAELPLEAFLLAFLRLLFAI